MRSRIKSFWAIFYLIDCLIFVKSSVIVEKTFETEDPLLKVAVLFRHGDRTPTSDSWSNDIYYKNHSIFREGKGQLTNKGKERMYELGEWFRERYSTFLPSEYHSEDIYVRSTDVDRTLMSAACNLAGLYPPTTDQTWNAAVPWQPIPIHTMPEQDDAVLTAEVPCAKHDYLTEEILKDQWFARLNAAHSDMYRNISELSGAEINDFRNMSWIYSTIRVYQSYNLTVPEWADRYITDITALAGIKFQIPTWNAAVARLRTGPFFNHLLTQLGTDNGKFFMFSAHDTTVADVSNTLRAFDDVPPEFGSSIIWEMRQNERNESYLMTYFKNSTHFQELNVLGCGYKCEFANFKSFLEPIAVDVDAWYEECVLDSSKKES